MLLDRKLFFVKEHVGMLKLTGAYDILDPETNTKIGIAKEEPGIFKYLKFIIDKKVLPNVVNVYDDETNEVVVSIKKKWSFIRSKVMITGKDGKEIGYFKSKRLSLGGGFRVYDNNDIQFADVKGDWVGWDFKIVDMSSKIIGTISKKWAGIGKELFTTADNYVLSLYEDREHTDVEAALILAAGLAIDIIYKEGK